MSAKRKNGDNGETPTPAVGAQPDRRAGERRTGKERRQRQIPVANDRRSGKDRRKVVRRINEYVLEPDVLEFINAVNEYKSVNQRPFPTWTEIYQIFLSLGYRRER
jgi:hypothetical protein